MNLLSLSERQTKWLLIFVAFVLVTLPTYTYAFNVRNSQVDACQRANLSTRHVQAGFILDAKERNQNSLGSQSGAEAEATKTAIANYETRYLQLVTPLVENGLQLYEDYQNKVAKESRILGTYVDCQEAYQRPFPFSLID